MILFYPQDMETIGQRIEAVRLELGLSKTEIWKPAKLSSGVYSQWMNGMQLDGDNLIKVASILKVNPKWLQTGKGNKNETLKAQEELTPYQVNNLNVPMLNAYGSMGNGNEVADNEIVIDVLRVSKDWVKKTLSPISDISNLAFIHAIGDSMHPTFNDGDILLVDTGAKNVSTDSVYVLEAHDRLFIKRVRRRLDGEYEISSDNAAVKTVDTLNGDHEVSVKGRVVWVWNGRRV